MIYAERSLSFSPLNAATITITKGSNLDFWTWCKNKCKAQYVIWIQLDDDWNWRCNSLVSWFWKRNIKCIILQVFYKSASNWLSTTVCPCLHCYLFAIKNLKKDVIIFWSLQPSKHTSSSKEKYLQCFSFLLPYLKCQSQSAEPWILLFPLKEAK